MTSPHTNATTDPNVLAGTLRASRWFGVLFVLGFAGLASRTFLRPWMPDWVLLYVGDALWSMVLYGVVAWSFQAWSSFKVCIVTLLLSFGVEGSQLIQVEWWVALRQTFPLPWILGQGFLFSDLMAYTVGCLVMRWLDACWLRR